MTRVLASLVVALSWSSGAAFSTVSSAPAAAAGAQRVRVSHILVESEELAEQCRSMLEGGTVG